MGRFFGIACKSTPRSRFMNDNLARKSSSIASRSPKSSIVNLKSLEGRLVNRSIFCLPLFVSGSSIRPTCTQVRMSLFCRVILSVSVGATDVKNCQTAGAY